MNLNPLPSVILEDAVRQLSRLPGVGSRSALRYALHLQRCSEAEVRDFADAVLRLKTHLHECRHCHNISDTEVCPVCSSPKRQRNIVCVVENIQEVMAIENTRQYRGLYHVLGGVISPVDGIGVGDLHIASLLQRVREGVPDPVEEVILALPTTMEGDTTSFYISKQLDGTQVKITTLARGVAIGDNLEYADEVTLGRSIAGRVPFNR
ncbi:MAG: recombination protein RecR [bacterium P3]|nr:MAG: recombination protein RecR [bacterium P3]KWW41040.1 MAG: recombination protein RecR [bacterium F083]